MIHRFILGPLIIVSCVYLMKYAVRVADFTGKIDWAERYMPYPAAGTYSFYRLFAIFVIILTLLWMFGYLNFLPF